MIKEIVHFLRKAPEVVRLQRQYARAEFVDALNARVDAQGYAEVRRELVGDPPVWLAGATPGFDQLLRAAARGRPVCRTSLDWASSHERPRSRQD